MNKTAEQINLPQVGKVEVCEAVAVRGSQLPNTRRDSLAIENFETVLRFAIEKGVSLQEIIAVRRELKAEQEKAAFDAALTAFQAECPVIAKSTAVVVGGAKAYGYAKFEDVIAVVKPYLQKHGFNFTLDTDTASEDGWVIAKCHVTHAAGHCRTSTSKFPIGTGTRLMSATQVFAGALSFASRRVFCNAFGIVTAGEDADGAGAKPKPDGPSTKAAPDPDTRPLLKTLWGLLPSSVAGKSPNWSAAKQFLVDENFITPDEHGGNVHAPTLSAARLQEIIAAVKARAA